MTSPMWFQFTFVFLTAVVLVQSVSQDGDNQPTSSVLTIEAFAWKSSSLSSNESSNLVGSTAAGTGSSKGTDPEYFYPLNLNASVCSDSAEKTPECVMVTTATGKDVEFGSGNGTVYTKPFVTDDGKLICFTAQDLGPIDNATIECPMDFNTRDPKSRFYTSHWRTSGTLYVHRVKQTDPRFDLRSNALCWGFPDNFNSTVDAMFSCHTTYGDGLDANPNLFTMATFIVDKSLVPPSQLAQVTQDVNEAGQPVFRFDSAVGSLGQISQRPAFGTS